MAKDVAGRVRAALAKMQALQQAVNEVKQPSNMAKLGEQIRSMIKIRTRVGFGVDSTGQAKHPMKPLSPGYIQQRKDQQGSAAKKSSHITAPSSLGGQRVRSKNEHRDLLHQHGGLSPETTPSKSNLTRTGQLLDSEAVKSVGFGRVAVGPTGDRTDSKHTNAEIAAFQEAKGRIYNKLSDIELKRLNDTVKNMVRSIMRAKLTK